MTDIFKTIENIVNNFPNPISLIIGNVLIPSLNLTIFFPIAEHLQIDIFYQVVTLASQLVIWNIFYIYTIFKLPSGNPKKITIVFSMCAENPEQVVRYENDLINRINTLIQGNELAHNIEIITLKNQQSKRVCRILSQFIQNKNNNKKFNSLQKKIKGDLYIYGNIKERNHHTQSYIIETNYLIRHANVNEKIQKDFADDMSSTLLRNFIIPKDNEYIGFIMSASSILICAEYTIGIAAYISGDVPLSIKFHEDCLSNTENIKSEDNITKIRNSLLLHLKDEYLLAALICFKNGDKNNAKMFIDKLTLHSLESYESSILKSVIDFDCGDISSAIKDVANAEKKNLDGTWRYNKAFLLMFTGKYKEAYAIYKKICKVSYSFEEKTIQEVINFLKLQLSINKEKIEPLFILGYIEYKKNNNPIEALSYFNEFIRKSNDYKYDFLNKKVCSFIAEINSKKMNKK